jgi:hypothetical protein
MAQLTLVKISHLKAEMEQKASDLEYNFTHPEIIELSQQLDILIIQYIKLKKQLKTSLMG